MRLTIALILTTAILGACSNHGLKQVQSTSRGPDEFVVDPKAELVLPEDFAQLPTPTPGQGNRADVDPTVELAAALGGRASSATGPIPSSDGALVTAASRFGVTPDIRQALAAEDEDFRKRNARFTQFQIFPENLYDKVYRSQTLDARATAEAWRRAGARLPSFPPVR